MRGAAILQTVRLARLWFLILVVSLGQAPVASAVAVCVDGAVCIECSHKAQVGETPQECTDATCLAAAPPKSDCSKCCHVTSREDNQKPSVTAKFVSVDVYALLPELVVIPTGIIEIPHITHELLRQYLPNGPPGDILSRGPPSLPA